MFIAPPVQTPFGQKPMPIVFGNDNEVRHLESWEPLASETSVAKDSMEYARLAGKRWRYYAGRNEMAQSLSDLATRINNDSELEIGFLLVGRANWEEAPSDTLVGAWCRRTYCNHLVLDFLMVHPDATGKANGYGRLGLSMLLALSWLSRRIKSPLLWGEATKSSAGFYEGVLGKYGAKTCITDHFFFEDNILEKLAKEGDNYVLYEQ
jgi:hypothetical protein